MTAPAFIKGILGVRNGIPNNADKGSVISKAISAQLLSILGVVRTALPSDAEGTALEVGVAEYLAAALPVRDPARSWEVDRRKRILDFDQYQHLARLDELVLNDPTLRTELGREYLIKPDVTVGVPVSAGQPATLHAAISCKWTIRSDRVQNIRHEGVVMTRTRRGRQPHVVTVTAEPMATRLASIARGTGEVDTVYHVALDELVTATAAAGTAEQKNVLDELIQQKRLADFETMVEVLATV